MAFKIIKKAQTIHTARALRIIDAIGVEELSMASITRATGLRTSSVTKTLKALVRREILEVRIESATDRKSPPRVFYKRAPRESEEG